MSRLCHMNTGLRNQIQIQNNSSCNFCAMKLAPAPPNKGVGVFLSYGGAHCCSLLVPFRNGRVQSNSSSRWINWARSNTFSERSSARKRSITESPTAVIAPAMGRGPLR
jgi:hypothetical protein